MLKFFLFICAGIFLIEHWHTVSAVFVTVGQFLVLLVFFCIGLVQKVLH